MKREIKFRKWHKGLEDMSFWDGSSESTIFFWKTLMDYPQMYELMQFTGLKDKNGVEIYEGDIWKRSTLFGVIEFHEGSWCVKWTHGGYGDLHANVLHSNILHEYIIGNIYEHTELLK